MIGARNYTCVKAIFISDKIRKYSEELCELMGECLRKRKNNTEKEFNKLDNNIKGSFDKLEKQIRKELGA